MFCFPYIYDAFLNNNLSVDVFIHTWNMCRVIDLYKPKKYEIEKYDSTYILNNILSQLILPNNLLVQGNINSNILQFYTNSKCYSLVSNDYDYVIRCRFDVIIQDKFYLEPIIEDLENDRYDIFCPDEVFNFGGYQDRILIGKYESMKYAMNLLQNINYYANKLNEWRIGSIILPEVFLKANLDDNNIRVFQKDINHRLVRSSNVVTNWPENPYKFTDQ